MATKPSRKGMRPGWDRPRVNGKFARHADKPMAPYPARQTKLLQEMRGMIGRTAKRLEDMLRREDRARKPKKKKKKTVTEGPPPDAETGAPLEGQPEAAPKTETDDEDEAPTQAEYDRLLGKNGGVIDGMTALAQMSIRLIDKERETCDPADSQSIIGVDEADLDRRLRAEIARLSGRRRLRGGVDGDGEISGTEKGAA